MIEEGLWLTIFDDSSAVKAYFDDILCINEGSAD
jgi:hypothetical protein